jgi:hypothetical protein
MHEKAKWRRSNLRHFFAGNLVGKGFFYSVNVRNQRTAISAVFCWSAGMIS